MAAPLTSSRPKSLINLMRGWPSPHTLPADLLRTAASKTLSDPSIFVPALQYAPDPGYQPLREKLAAWLGKQYGTEADPDRICITGGASQNLACILQSFTEPTYTQAVWAVAPCYFLACPIFEDSGFKDRLRAVPEDDEGIDLGALEKGLASFDTKEPGKAVYKDPGPHRKFYRHVIYVVPTCANPSGKTMSLRRREGLVRLARKYDALVICDDVYDFLQWPVVPNTAPTQQQAQNRNGNSNNHHHDHSSQKLDDQQQLNPPPDPLPLPHHALLPRLSTIDSSLGPSPHDRSPARPFGHAVSNGSFSKLVGPGVRTGWVDAAPAFAHGLSQTGSTRSGGAASQLAAAVVCEMLRAGDLDAHLARTARPALQRRHARALAAVRELLVGPFGVRVREAGLGPREERDGEDGGEDGKQKQPVYGGYFLWLTLRSDGPTAEAIAARAKKEENLIIGPGPRFEVYGDQESVQFKYNIRLCFSWEDEDVVVEGIERLARVMRDLYDQKGAKE